MSGQVTALPPPGGDDPRVEIQLPASIEGTRWTARGSGPLRTLVKEQLAALPDSEVLAEYGLVKLSARTYSDGASSLTAEAFEFGYPTGAYGYFTFNRNTIGADRREFVAGRYLISLRKDESAGLPWETTLGAFDALFAGAKLDRMSPIMSHLPQDSKVAGSEKYIIGPLALGSINQFADLSRVIDFSGGVEVALADYRTGDSTMKLAIIEFHTPQFATAGFQATVDQFNALSEQEKSKRLVKRVGNYVVVAAGVSDATLANPIIDQVKYAVKIYWEGRKFTSIPMEFRPPDPAALEEAAETAVVLLRTFYGIGILLLSAIIIGVFSGWSVFTWRRYKRRKLGLENIFSDAGGTIQLNLDHYLLEAGEPGSKLLGKGDA